MTQNSPDHLDHLDHLDRLEEQYENHRHRLAEQMSQQQVEVEEIRLEIEAGALSSKRFYLLNGLAAIIAGFGLLANSPAVVIGAMLVAMLISPISAIALAIIENRYRLLRQALLTLLGGGAVIYIIGLILGSLYPEQAMSGEIISRTSPNTMDVIVALAGGTAGAYALISRNLSVAVVGVAVATALVPPLTASGILTAVGQFPLAFGAFMLTLTNILAIQLTTALVLWLAGFGRRNRSAPFVQLSANKGQIGAFIRGNLVTVLLLGAISVYLTYNFQQKIHQQGFEKQVNQLIRDAISQQPLYVVNSSFGVEDKTRKQAAGSEDTHKAKRYLIRVVMQGLVPPSPQQVLQLERQINTLSQQQFASRADIRLQVRFIQEQVIETTPVTSEDVKLDDASQQQLSTDKTP